VCQAPFVTVDEDAISAATLYQAQEAGDFAEPGAAATLAGAWVAREQGIIERNERALLIATGNGLKNTEVVAKSATTDAPLAPTHDALEARLEAEVGRTSNAHG
jgi:threonine synthase